jgi:ABC-type multidrug transport system fused ATPase/permease subunit
LSVRSGAGKTTMVNLLPRFYDVSAGAILIDGVDIRKVTTRRCASRSDRVRRTPCRSTTSIRGNIAYGSPQATPAAD